MQIASSSPEQTRSDDRRYIAFCDILGFSNRILTDFDATLKAYREFGDLVSDGQFRVPDVHVTMYSDAMLLTGTSLLESLE